MLDSRVVVGLGKHTLLPGHVREFGHHGGLQGVRSVLVAPVDDSFAGFQKKYSLGGCRGERFINRSVVSSLGISANSVTMEAFRKLTLLWWIMLIIRALLQPLFCLETVKGLSTETTITLLTPWRPPWWPGSRILRTSGSQKCCWDPVDYPLPLQPSGEVFCSKTNHIGVKFSLVGMGGGHIVPCLHCVYSMHRKWRKTPFEDDPPPSDLVATFFSDYFKKKFLSVSAIKKIAASLSIKKSLRNVAHVWSKTEKIQFGRLRRFKRMP